MNVCVSHMMSHTVSHMKSHMVSLMSHMVSCMMSHMVSLMDIFNTILLDMNVCVSHMMSHIVSHMMSHNANDANNNATTMKCNDNDADNKDASDVDNAECQFQDNDATFDDDDVKVHSAIWPPILIGRKCWPREMNHA